MLEEGGDAEAALIARAAEWPTGRGMRWPTWAASSAARSRPPLAARSSAASWRPMVDAATRQAGLVCHAQSSSAFLARSGDALATVATIRVARSRSFSLVARTSTMRFPYVLPSWIITAVERMFRVIFCAVPAFESRGASDHLAADEELDRELGGTRDRAVGGCRRSRR